MKTFDDCGCQTDAERDPASGVDVPLQSLVRLSDAVGAMIHAFGDKERRDAVKNLAARVRKMEKVVEAAMCIRQLHDSRLPDGIVVRREHVVKLWKALEPFNPNTPLERSSVADSVKADVSRLNGGGK